MLRFRYTSIYYSLIYFALLLSAHQVKAQGGGAYSTSFGNLRFGYAEYFPDAKALYAIDTSKLYSYDEEGVLTNKPQYTSYTRKYKLITTEPKLYRVTDYWPNGKVKSRRNSVEGSPSNLLGEWKEYSPDGEQTFETVFKKNEKGIYYEAGPRIYYYKNDQIKSIIQKVYTNVGVKNLIVQYFDTSGTPTVKSGIGYKSETIKDPWSEAFITFQTKIINGLSDSICTGLYPDGSIYSREVFENGLFKKGTSYDKAGTAYTYTDVDEKELHDINTRKLTTALRDNIPYDTRENTASSSVDVTKLDKENAATCTFKFITNDNGEVVEYRLLKGVNDNIDNAVLISAHKIKKVQKVKHRGRYLAQSHTISLIFPID